MPPFPSYFTAVIVMARWGHEPFKGMGEVPRMNPVPNLIAGICPDEIRRFLRDRNRFPSKSLDILLGPLLVYIFSKLKMEM